MRRRHIGSPPIGPPGPPLVPSTQMGPPISFPPLRFPSPPLPAGARARPAGPQPSRPGRREAPDVRDTPARPAFDPRFAKQTVDYITDEKPGSIVIDTRARYLYLVQEDGKAIRYGIGVGRVGFTWSGIKTVSQKREWPDWTPPPEMLKRRPDLPTWMAGGVDNPLGARAIYLGSTLYRIHGSNEPWTIGQAVSSGCFRMRNDDVMELYDKVKIGTKVVVI